MDALFPRRCPPRVDANGGRGDGLPQVSGPHVAVGKYLWDRGECVYPAILFAGVSFPPYVGGLLRPLPHEPKRIPISMVGFH